MDLVSASLGTGKVWMGVAGAALILFGAALLALVDAPRRALHWLDPRRLRRRGAEARRTPPAVPVPPAGQGVMGGGPVGWLNGTVSAPRIAQPVAIATALAVPPAPQPASPVPGRVVPGPVPVFGPAHAARRPQAARAAPTPVAVMAPPPPMTPRPVGGIPAQSPPPAVAVTNGAAETTSAQALPPQQFQTPQPARPASRPPALGDNLGELTTRVARWLLGR